MLTKIIILFNIPRLLLHLLCYVITPNKPFLNQDLTRWAQIELDKDISKSRRYIGTLLYFLVFHQEFRNLFYYRIKSINKIISKFISLFCPPLSTLYISMPPDTIGPGFYIQHGFSTMIGAKKIGANFWLNQQVSIGYTNATDCPVIKDNVYVYAGAKILGAVTIGNNSFVGANAVVVKSVPDNCTVVGVPAHIIRKDGKRVDEKL